MTTITALASAQGYKAPTWRAHQWTHDCPRSRRPCRTIRHQCPERHGGGQRRCGQSDNYRRNGNLNLREVAQPEARCAVRRTENRAIRRRESCKRRSRILDSCGYDLAAKLGCVFDQGHSVWLADAEVSRNQGPPLPLSPAQTEQQLEDRSSPPGFGLLASNMSLRSN